MFTFAMLSLAATLSTQSIDGLAWMAGDWSCPKWGGVFEERWSPPASGSMVGSGRLMVDGKTTFIEFMSIEPTEGGLTMFMVLGKPSKGVGKPVPFTLTKASPGEAVFECPTNDFPSKITYTKKESTLVCVLEGVQNDKPAREEFQFKPILSGVERKK